MRKVFLVILVFLSLFIFSNPVLAHPGRTAADGCHYCRTRCDYWGVPWNERHCHNGGTVQGVQESAPIYNPPNTPIPWPTWTPIPTYIPAPMYTPIPTLTNTLTPTPTNTPSPTPTITSTPKPTKVISVINKINKSKKQIVKKKTFWQWLFNL